jgi:hypothetical protein
MDQALLDQVLYWLLLPFQLLHCLWTTVVFCISTVLWWLHEALVYFWTMVVLGVAVALSGLLIPLQLLCALPYLWLRAIFGVSIGLFFTRKTIGLLVCMLGNVLLFTYAALRYGPPDGPPEMPVALLSWSIFAFWFAGWILRWIFLRVPGGRPLVIAGAMIVVGLSLFDVALHHTALVVALHHNALVWVVRIAGIVLAAAGGILAIFGLQAFWEERIALMLDNRRFRRSLRH